jgi:hypothetical protein
MPVIADIRVVARASGAEAAHTRSGKDGKYAAAVPPGNYSVQATSPDVSFTCRPVDVTVTSGSYANANIECR